MGPGLRLLESEGGTNLCVYEVMNEESERVPHRPENRSEDELQDPRLKKVI